MRLPILKLRIGDIGFKNLISYFIPVLPITLLKRLLKHPLYPATKLVHFNKILKVIENEEQGIYKSLEQLYKLNRTFTEIEIRELPESTRSSERLFRLFGNYGSDKAIKHGYHLIYGEIFEKLKNSEFNILEIGIGSINPELVSNMGRGGHPGASLHAFRDFSEKIKVTGVDIDRDTLFADTRIETFFLDQTSAQSWSNLIENLNGKKFDLIIDDGLHSPSTNMNSIIFGSKILKNGGLILIEDIQSRALPVWSLVHKLLSNDAKSHLIKCKNSYIFFISK